jgi:hypothetical protein
MVVLFWLSWLLWGGLQRLQWTSTTGQRPRQRSTSFAVVAHFSQGSEISANDWLPSLDHFVLERIEYPVDQMIAVTMLPLWTQTSRM